MTIEGAIVDLQNLIDDECIPFWAKPSLQKIKETVEAERERYIEERKTGKWVSVTERLPEKEGWYLAYKEDTIGGSDFPDVVYWLGTEWATFSIITRWMPLPPYEEGAEE